MAALLAAIGPLHPAAPTSAAPARVVIAWHPDATDAFKPRPRVISNMVAGAITQLTGKSSPAAAWQSLLGPNDTIGIKVYASPGANSGTRPAVVAAVIEDVLAAGIPARRIVVWDKHRDDLRRAGYFKFVDRYGIRVAGSAESGYDDKLFYETAFIGNLVWGDVEFGKTGEGIGRKSHVSRLLSREFTKIINITPLLNHNTASVCGNLFSLAMGSIDNSWRFETDAFRASEAVPEIYARKEIGDRVVLNITDALICQYQGEQRTLLHYSSVLNELRFSRDPVALDVLSVKELDRQRAVAQMPETRINKTLFENAELLDLGVADIDRITLERVNLPVDAASARGVTPKLALDPVADSGGTARPRGSTNR